MEPKEVVTARKNELLRADEQQQEASAGSNHQLPNIPATVTCTVFYGVKESRKREQMIKH